jgi:hypothetical protein
MPDPHRVEGELRQLYSKPQYSSRFEHEKRFGSDPRRFTPQSLAKRTAEKLFSDRSLLDPVYVEELRGGVTFYRAFDGISFKQGTAMTLGSYWSSSNLVKRIWKATEKWSGTVREEAFIDFMRSASFIHPAQNQMLHIACMRIPAGNCVVVIRGRGNWEALRTYRPGARKSAKPLHPFENPEVESVDDLIYSLRMLPIPGEEQFNIPLFNDAWVSKIERGPGWPLA